MTLESDAVGLAAKGGFNRAVTCSWNAVNSCTTGILASVMGTMHAAVYLVRAWLILYGFSNLHNIYITFDLEAAKLNTKPSKILISTSTPG